MELYAKTSYELARVLTERYSTSFTMSSTLFARSIRPHIYAIYAMVRLADEIVDTHEGPNAKIRLAAFERAVYDAMDDEYSSNPLLYAFSKTANIYQIDRALIASFFESMAMDLDTKMFDEATYKRYIYGSAEVVGLMCLKVFTEGNQTLYDSLVPGASALGAAYQKINFLRDIKADYEELGRVYFPNVTYPTFDDAQKLYVIEDIKKDIAVAQQAVSVLPASSQKAVRMSLRYYQALLNRLEKASAKDLKSRRIRVPNAYKLALLLGAWR